MKVYPIEDALAGEEVLAVQPAMTRRPEADWRERLAYFTGRALTEGDLRQEQRARSGLLAGLGRTLSPGVVHGLEVVARASGAGTELEIAAGLGLAANGEVVNVNRNRRVRLEDIRVYAPQALLEGGGGGEGPWLLGDSLEKVLARGVDLPDNLILLLQPVVIEHHAGADEAELCDHDPSDEAFENWQWVEGSRLVLYAWDPVIPFELSPGPARPTARSEAAYRIFEQERHLAEGARMPWWEVGLPVALVGLDATHRFAFIDRNSVVRRGGEARGVASPIRPAGDRFLWQARFEQFNEQLADWLHAEPALDPAGMRAVDCFRFLPPVGVLPPQTLWPREPADPQRFFPPAWHVEARVIPQEQLDLAIEESASLQPFDLYAADRVEVLVPVPQAVFDPALLQRAGVADELVSTLAEARLRRDQWLGRRQAVRQRASALYRAIEGEALDFPVADPEAVDEGETPADFEHSLLRDAAGGECRYLSAPAAPAGWPRNDFDDSAWTPCIVPLGTTASGGEVPAVDAAEHVFQRFHFDLEGEAVPVGHRYVLLLPAVAGGAAPTVYLNGRRLPLRPEEGGAEGVARYTLGELRGILRARGNVLALTGLGSARADLVDLRDSEEAFGTQTGASGVESVEFARLRALLGGGANDPLATLLSDDDRELLASRGIKAFVTEIRRRIARANDRVDFGFLRLRTDIYRMRQFMLGSEAATRLATSPALAEIARGESVTASRKELATFYERIREGLQFSAAGKKDNDGGDGDGDGDRPSPAGQPAGTIDDTGGYIAAASLPGNSAASVGRVVPSYVLPGEVFGAGAPDAGRPSVLRYTGGREFGRKEVRAAGSAGLSGALFFSARRAELADKQLAAAASPEDIEGETGVIGWASKIQNVTLGQRLQVSGAEVSYQSGLGLKGDLINEINELGMIFDNKLIEEIAGEDFTPPEAADDLEANRDAIDEGRFFDSGVRLMENVTRLLRHVESRVAAYRRLLKRCEASLAAIRADLRRAEGRLGEIGDELAEARHDVSVARALLAEETARAAAVNARRDKILRTQVPFLAFRRPRRVDPNRDAPVHYLNPGLSEQPLPLCGEAAVETPEALAAMLDVLREAPLRWFTAVRTIMPGLSRIADLQATLAAARRRVDNRPPQNAFLQGDFQGGDRLWQGLGNTVVQAGQRVFALRRASLGVDMGRFSRLGWQAAVQRLPEVVSLGDVIDGGHGRILVSRRAAGELAHIARVATCLYEDFSAVPAAIRLDWAERLSQFDRPVRLRNLLDLPRFDELDYLRRHDMQRLVDWLYSRVDGRYGEALDLIGDLIRVALLSASHAPVDRLISAHLAAPANVRPGGRIRLIADLGRVRIGMPVSLASSGRVALGRVTDIVDGEVVAEVASAPEGGMELDSGAQVQIGGRLSLAVSYRAWS